LGVFEQAANTVRASPTNAINFIFIFFVSF